MTTLKAMAAAAAGAVVGRVDPNARDVLGDCPSPRGRLARWLARRELYFPCLLGNCPRRAVRTTTATSWPCLQPGARSSARQRAVATRNHAR